MKLMFLIRCQPAHFQCAIGVVWLVGETMSDYKTHCSGSDVKL